MATERVPALPLGHEAEYGPGSMKRPDTVVIGGGIAGLAAAWRLAQRGRKVLLLEQETQTGSHSSARNAAIWLPFDDVPSTPVLAKRSAALLDELLGPGRWRTQHEALVVSEGTGEDLEAPLRVLRAAGLRAQLVEAPFIGRRAPALRGGRGGVAVWVEDAAILDIHAMVDGLSRAARRCGVEVRTAQRVTKIRRRENAQEQVEVCGVELESGGVVESSQVLIAGGAWAADLGRSCAAGLPIQAFRRHLVQLDVAAAAASAIVWRVGDEVYYRPESEGLLASPCEELPFEPCLPPADDACLGLLARKLEGLAPALIDAKVRRHWACLRTFAADRELVLGVDPRIRGLHWFAGLGGRGMTIGVAAGDLCAALLAESSGLAGSVLDADQRAMAGSMDPGRLLVRSSHALSTR